MTLCDDEKIEETPVEQEAVEAPVNIPIHTRFWLSMKIGVVGKLLPVWAVSLVLSLFVVFMLESLLAVPVEPQIELWSAEFYIIGFISFLSMYLNSALGMGYGVTIIPIMILFMGFDAIAIVPALLVSQFLAEIAAGVSHQSAGNVDLSAKSIHLKVAMVLAGCAIIGAPLAVKLIISITNHQATLAIGLIVLLTGLSIFITMGRRFRFSWRKIVLLGLVASFLKGFSGGGYGPIVTGGQILCGIGGKQAVGVKSIAEGFTCLVAVMGFLATGRVHDLTVAYPLTLGAICSVPISAYTVRKLGTKKVTTTIAGVTIVLGSWLIIKTLHDMGIF